MAGKNMVRWMHLFNLTMQDFGKVLMIVGVVIVILGFLFWQGLGGRWLGHLPGDIAIHKGNTRFYFPLATCLLISLVLTLLYWLFRKL
jgi:hypothetical protein